MPTDLPTDSPGNRPPDPQGGSPNERGVRRAGTMELDPASGENVAIDETPRLIASGKVEGTPVFDTEGARLGSVYNFMVDKVSGQVAYAVLSFGGFLGIGETYHPLPWNALRYSVERGGYVVDIDPRTLEGAPTHGPGEDPFGDPGYGTRLDDYYGGRRAPTA